MYIVANRSIKGWLTDQITLWHYLSIVDTQTF